MRRPWLMVATAVCVIAAGGTAAALVTPDAGGDPAETDGGTTAGATAQARRGDLVESTSATGTLEYAESRDLVSPLSGTLTWLPQAGRLIESGRALYRVDDQPVVRFDGALPAWRDLDASVSTGQDVKQLEEALLALGYGDEYDMDADGDWTWVTTEAVEEWQDDMGFDVTGELPLGTVVFTDGDLRVDAQLLDVGDRVAPSTAVLDVSDVARRVTASLDTNQRHLAPIGGEVGLDFPDGSTARGRITAVDVVPAVDEQSEETLQVTIEPLGKKSRRALRGQLDGSSLLVTFTDTLAEDVLIVPVTALVALADGEYAVEVADSGETRLVSVTTEGFADSSVAVSGELKAGDSVVVTP